MNARASLTGRALARAGHELFPELATTFFCFIQRLHDVLIAQGCEHVYFLSREGQPLKQMFDLYRERAGTKVVSHYLEVSRRSTLLPSLESLADEAFDTLFRQYRCISLVDFLSSLGFEDHIQAIVFALGLIDGEEACRQEDFLVSPVFAALKALPEFQSLYESERVARRSAFLAYLSELSGGALPTRLVIVDVGWKGTIQDNLFKLLCRGGDTPVRQVVGYYIGLVANGGGCQNNDKHGLLFSSVGAPSPKFHIFNENRALFEIVLAADHGSIVGYEILSDSRGRPVRGQFEEREMVVDKVFPVLHQIFNGFDRILNEFVSFNGTRVISFDDVVRAHARMVFRPTQSERAWFSSVFHVENFGVFERSNFSLPAQRPTLGDRMSLLLKVLRRRSVGSLGFWPWRTLDDRVGTLFAAIYAVIRRAQS